MRIKLKKVTVASLNASLVQTRLPVIHSEIYNNAETTSQNQDWYCSNSVRTCTNVSSYW